MITRRTTSLLCARQALPRPARLYSTPSKKLNSPATAAATSSAAVENFPLFLNQNAEHTSVHTPAERLPQLRQFLDRGVPITVLPTPEPYKEATNVTEGWFADSHSLDMTGIIDACLHNLYDVPRAQEVFQRLRKKPGSAALQTAVYNAFLDAYTGMAKKEENRKEYWIEEAWKLYQVMESGAEKISPTAKTYAIMLSIWHE